MDNTGATTTGTPIYDALVASLSAGGSGADTPRPSRPQAPEPPDHADVSLLTGPRPRLSEATTHVVKAAEREAHALGHDRLGVAHLVLGLLLTDGQEAGRLHRAGLDLVALRRYLEDDGHRAPSAGQAWRGVAPTLIWTSAAAQALAAARDRAGDAGRPEALPGDLLDALTTRPGAWAPAVDDAPRLSA